MMVIKDKVRIRIYLLACRNLLNYNNMFTLTLTIMILGDNKMMTVMMHMTQMMMLMAVLTMMMTIIKISNNSNVNNESK